MNSPAHAPHPFHGVAQRKRDLLVPCAITPLIRTGKNKHRAFALSA